MKRLLIGKDDTAAAVVEKILETADDEIVIVVPKQSTLRTSLTNFRVIKREAQAAGRVIAIESVDNEVLVMAKKADIDARHPLLHAPRPAGGQRAFSDIVAHGRAPSREPEAREPEEEAIIEVTEQIVHVPVQVKRGAKKGPPKITDTTRLMIVPEDIPADEGEEEIDENDKAVAFWRGRPAPSTPSALQGGEAPIERSHTVRPPRRIFRLTLKRFAVLVTLLFVFGGGAWTYGKVFGRATVTLTFKRTPLDYSGTFIADKAVTAKANAEQPLRLPAEVLVQQKNLTQFFPASGRAEVSQKATGRITIYNAFSSEPQTLVATTRFVTPDGKIFRLDTATVVPGAQIKDGKIIPSNIVATVTADKAGDQYNVGPIEKLVIPGFKGTPRYEGFYGTFSEKTSGGFIGERAVPTEADIAAAREKVTALLTTSLENNLINNRPGDFMVIEGSGETTVTRLVVNSATDDQGNFSVLGEAQHRAVAFREDDLRRSLLALVADDRVPPLVIKEANIRYENPVADFAKGTIKFTVVAQGYLGPDFNAEDLKTQIAGATADAARQAVAAVPELAEAKISFSPVWLSTIPRDPGRVAVVTR